MKISTETLLKFPSKGNIQELTGGQGQSILFGDLVIKPVHDAQEYLWLATIFETLNLTGINLATPVRSLNGNYLEDNCGATSYFDNNGHSYDVYSNIQLCRKLNFALKPILKPVSIFEDLNNPWKKALHIAWNDEPRNGLPKELEYLLALRKPVNLPAQLIHMDFAGNVLINKYNETCIIDFTPGFYPMEFAEAIILVDSIAWYHAPLSALKQLEIADDLVDQLLLLALIFRMSVPLFFDPDNKDSFYQNFPAFKGLYNYLLRHK